MREGSIAMDIANDKATAAYHYFIVVGEARGACAAVSGVVKARNRADAVRKYERRLMRDCEYECIDDNIWVDDVYDCGLVEPAYAPTPWEIKNCEPYKKEDRP
jgi:hypothetical protein